LKPYLKKPFKKIGLVERLKVETLSSSPNTGKKKNARWDSWSIAHCRKEDK
jgi:hypothetical protein